MLCDLDRELHLGRLTRHLRPVVKIDDPHARRFAYRRAGAGAVDPRDDLRAADLVRAQRRALMAPARPLPSAPTSSHPEPEPDDLVALMSGALVRAVRLGALDLDDARAVEMALAAAGFTALQAGNPVVVGPAVARARARLRRRALLDHAADGAAFATLILAWTAGYCLLCPPAHAATAVAAYLTDERLSRFFTWAPLLIAVLLLVGLGWADWGTASAEDDGEPARPARPRFAADAPTTAPALADLDDRRRAADRG